MNTVVLSGSIIAGPQGSGDCSFPNGIVNVSISASQSAPAMVAASPTVNSPSAYVTLPGIGTGGLVTKANFLFVQTQSKMWLRLTITPDSGGDILSEIPISGPMIIPLPDTNTLKLLEAKGVGTLEFLATGNS